VERSFFASSATYTDNKSRGMPCISTAFARIFAAISIIEQDGANFSTLDNRTTSISNELLAAVE
jgi:hypothetical protein